MDIVDLVICIVISTITIMTIKCLFIDQKRFWREHQQELSDQDREIEKYLAELWEVPLSKVQVAMRNLDLEGEAPQCENYQVPNFEAWGRFEFLKWYEERSMEVNGLGVNAIFSSKSRPGRLKQVGRRIRSIFSYHPFIFP